MNILVGSASSSKAIVVAKYLKKKYSHLSIIGIDFRSRFKIVHSKYYDKIIIEHSFLNKKHIECITKILLKESIDIYLPIDSTEYNIIFENKTLLGTKQLNYLGSPDSYNILNNKDKLYELCKSHGISVPNSFINESDKIKVGFVVKPTNLASSKGVFYVHKKIDIRKVQHKAEMYDNFIVQEYISGIGVGYSVFAKKGKIIIGYGHKRLSEFPISGGSSNYRTSFFHKDMSEVAQTIIRITNWSGFAMFEFKLTKENRLFLIEVNPRIWGSINQGLQNGVNYFSELIGEIGENIQRKEIKTFLSPIILLSLICYFLKGKIHPLVHFFMNIQRSKVDVSFLNDPLGYLSIILRKI